jgi:hypothetical protein
MIISKPPLAELRQHEAKGEPTDYGLVRYVIAKHLTGRVGEERTTQQRAHIARLGLGPGDDPDRFQIDFALTHGGF